MTLTGLGETFNVASLLPEAALRTPDATALIARRGRGYRRLTFAELDRWSDAQAHALRRLGFGAGERVLMLVKNGPAFVSATFALFKLGALPVLIDPGMGLKPMLRCIAQLEPRGLVAVPRGHLVRRLFPAAFGSIDKAACLDGRFPGVPQLPAPTSGRNLPRPAFEPEATPASAPAAVLFTSGSTGPAKGVVYRHEIFRAQVDHLRTLYGFEPGEVDLPGFPLFALFSVAMGVTCVIPPLNPSRPATVDPGAMLRTIEECGVTSLQGSPAIWERVGAHCAARDVKLSNVRRLITFGAPIGIGLMRTWEAILPESADIHTPYGATEALPVCTITAREVLRECVPLRLEGAGTCVGRPVPGVDVELVAIEDGPVDALHHPAGPEGEVVVRGTIVTHAYEGLPEATRAAKIETPEGLWHRMGDLGRFDEAGRLWLVGRKGHRVEGEGKVYFPVAAEGMVNEHPEVRRSALVGVDGRPVLVVQRAAGSRTPSEQLSRELLALLARHPLYGDVRRVLYRRELPVDPRHNAKIHREELALWAKEQR